MVNPNRRTTILALGNTGNGKSTLLNFLLGNEYLQTGSQSHSVTSETILVTKNIDDYELNVIDTQGYNDSYGNEARNNDQMTTFLRGYDKGVNLIIITLKANDVRISNEIKIMFQKIYQMFGTEELFNHLCIVYTFYYSAVYDNSDKERLGQLTKDVRRELMGIANITNAPSIPYYCIDSKPRTYDPSSNEQKAVLIESALSKICLPTTSVFTIDPNIRETISERRNHFIIDQKNENKITSTTYADQKRNKYLYWNGEIGYDNWVNLNYEIVNRIHKTQKRTECDYHSAHSMFGFSSKRHNHYKIFLRNFDQQQIIKLDQNRHQISSTGWDTVNGTFTERQIDSGEERGWGRQSGIVDV